jgi:predicted phage terminase large subunit-like protein
MARLDKQERARRAAIIAWSSLEQDEKEPPAAGEPHDYQIPPEDLNPDDRDWAIWLLEGGRGAGKTWTGSRYCLRYLREMGPAARIYIGAPTRDDARDICAEGPSGLITAAPSEFEWHRSDRQAFHKGGGYVRFLGSEEPDRWNGPGFGLLWADELSLWSNAKGTHGGTSWEMAQFCLREGDWPRAVVTTTPKRSALIKQIKGYDTTRAVHATTYDNTKLPPARIAQWEAMFGKDTRLARMEMLAMDPPAVEGAMWEYDWIDTYRRSIPVEDLLPQLSRVIVAIDPGGTMNRQSAMTAIVVVGYGYDGHRYVLDAEAALWSPNAWAQSAIRKWARYQAEKIVAESNYGGDMVEATLTNAWNDAGLSGELGLWGGLPFEQVHASRGKAIRAEPIAALYEQHLVHHNGIFSDLEDQMTSFPVEVERLDLIDALVWGLTFIDTNTSFLSLATGRAKGW